MLYNEEAAVMAAAAAAMANNNAGEENDDDDDEKRRSVDTFRPLIMEQLRQHRHLLPPQIATVATSDHHVGDSQASHGACHSRAEYADLLPAGQ
jgi:hypothetical protein